MSAMSSSYIGFNVWYYEQGGSRWVRCVDARSQGFDLGGSRDQTPHSCIQTLQWLLVALS